MKPTKIISTAVFSSALVIAACSSSSTPKAASTSSSSGSSSSSISSSSSPSTSSATSSTLSVAMNSKVGKQIIVDSSGKTVYLYMPDGTGGTSKVPAAIKANWPAVPATGTLSAGSGLDQSKLTTQMQADGTSQLAYNGHLLYTFVGDKAAGDAGGQGLLGMWFTLSPSGDQNT